MTQSDKPRQLWLVSGEITISVHTIVSARSAAEARKVADREGSMMSLCHHCADGANSEEPGEWRTSGELDSAVTITEAEEYDGD